MAGASGSPPRAAWRGAGAAGPGAGLPSPCPGLPRPLCRQLQGGLVTPESLRSPWGCLTRGNGK